MQQIAFSVFAVSDLLISFAVQRQDYKLLQSGQSSRLNTKRLNLLRKLGFVWEVDRSTSRGLKDAVLKSNDRGKGATQSSSEGTNPVCHLQHDSALALSGNLGSSGSGKQTEDKGKAIHVVSKSLDVALISTSGSGIPQSEEALTKNDSTRAVESQNTSSPSEFKSTKPGRKRRRSFAIKQSGEKTKK